MGLIRLFLLHQAKLNGVTLTALMILTAFDIRHETPSTDELMRQRTNTVMNWVLHRPSVLIVTVRVSPGAASA